MKAAEMSRWKLRELMDTVYSKCARCSDEERGKLLVLSCLHVVCQDCVHSALQGAQEATTLPKKQQPTKYHDPRRMECPVCGWPQYVPRTQDGKITYPSQLPLFSQLSSVAPLHPDISDLCPESEKLSQDQYQQSGQLSQNQYRESRKFSQSGKTSQDHYPEDERSSQDQYLESRKPSQSRKLSQSGELSHSRKSSQDQYLESRKSSQSRKMSQEQCPESGKLSLSVQQHTTRQGGFVHENNLGSFGRHYQHGQMSSVKGLAVDDSHPGSPLVVVCEDKANVILTFHLSGKLEQARKVKVRLRDVCIGENGTIIAAVAEENYALAKWDSALTISGIRHENIFRHIYGHSAQINSEPFGVARDSHGRFMVTMLAKDRVCRWDEGRSGDHIYWFGDIGQKGTGLMGPYYIAKLSNDFSVVVSTNDHKVKVIDDENNLLVREMGGLGSDLPDLCFPHGVCVDRHDNIYIADTGNFRVVVYDKGGNFLSCALTDTWLFGSDVKPTHVAVVGDGRLVVVLQGREYCRVHVYRPRRERRESDQGEEESQWNWVKCWARYTCCVCGDYDALD